MIAAAVQDVNVVRDAWDWVALAAGMFGAVAAAVAIGFAVIAQRDATQARREATAERRRQFELEILREITREVEEQKVHYKAARGDPTVLGQFEVRISLLPPEDLPFWRQLSRKGWRQEVLDASGYTDRVKAVNERRAEVVKAQDEWSDKAAWEAEIERLHKELVDLNNEWQLMVADRLIRELGEAIHSRVLAGRNDRSIGDRVRHWWKFGI